MSSTGAGGSAEKYDRLLELADTFDSAGADLRHRAALGARIVEDPAVAESAALAPRTWERLDDAVREATAGEHGLLARSIELDADALIVRATVLTYRWIDDLQQAAYRTLGSVAARAIGYLAPEVALGGAVVSAGLIETDALDRDAVTTYLDELAQNSPELLDHVTGGGGLLDGLRLRALLTTSALAEDDGAAARGGLAATGGDAFVPDLGSALRDVAAGLLEQPEVGEGVEDAEGADVGGGARPAGLADLGSMLLSATRAVTVRWVAPNTYLALLPGPQGHAERPLHLVGGDHQSYAQSYAERVVHEIEIAVAAHNDEDGGGDGGVEPARVLLAGYGAGGPTALAVAASTTSFRVERVVTAGAPSALVPRVPPPVRVISLEDRTDPVALLGSLVNATSENRVTVVFDAAGAEGPERYLVGARAVDDSDHPDLRRELDELRELGYLR